MSAAAIKDALVLQFEQENSPPWTTALSNLEVGYLANRLDEYGPTLSEKRQLVMLSLWRKATKQAVQRQFVMTTGQSTMYDPAPAWLSELEWARYKELTN